jgi:hypothetical protein
LRSDAAAAREKARRVRFAVRLAMGGKVILTPPYSCCVQPRITNGIHKCA